MNIIKMMLYLAVRPRLFSSSLMLIMCLLGQIPWRITTETTIWVDGIVRPTLIINSEDDMVCLPENIREDVVLEHGGALLLRTRRGSHIAFNEGLLGQGDYLSRVSMDFLESAKRNESQ